MKAEQERVRALLIDTITLLCKNGLSFDCDLKVQGLLGITIDNADVFVVHINDIIACETSSASASRSSVLEQKSDSHSQHSVVGCELAASVHRNQTSGFHQKKRQRLSHPEEKLDHSNNILTAGSQDNTNDISNPSRSESQVCSRPAVKKESAMSAISLDSDDEEASVKKQKCDGSMSISAVSDSEHNWQDSGIFPLSQASTVPGHHHARVKRSRLRENLRVVKTEPASFDSTSKSQDGSALVKCDNNFDASDSFTDDVIDSDIGGDLSGQACSELKWNPALNDFDNNEDYFTRNTAEIQRSSNNSGGGEGSGVTYNQVYVNGQHYLSDVVIGKHFLELIPDKKRKKCAICAQDRREGYKGTRISTWCRECGVGLCRGSCFVAYHDLAH